MNESRLRRWRLSRNYRPSWTPSASTTTPGARTVHWADEHPRPLTPPAPKPPRGVTPTHERVRRDRIDDSGVDTLGHHGPLHHIGIGPNPRRTPSSCSVGPARQMVRVERNAPLHVLTPS